MRPELHVYVNCLPIRFSSSAQKPLLLERWAAPFLAQVCRDHNVGDWGLIPYARGGAAVRALVREALENATEPLTLVVRREAPLGRELIELLGEFATSLMEKA